MVGLFIANKVHSHGIVEWKWDRNCTPCEIDVPEVIVVEEEEEEIEENTDNVVTTVFPNPFTNNATITFTIKEGCTVNVNLYNRIGLLMDNLFTGTVQSNETVQVQINADNLRGGIYFYTITTSTGDVVTKRIMLFK